MLHNLSLTLQAGTYFITIRSQDYMSTRKIIKL
ncbi:MAG: T9SS type A sorting domain-containing protein [Bacteroidales bacterium]|nr:T9SS type A sorting domain-containing protein [Bacteroidales bacterium]